MEDLHRTLFFATYSISESPLELRDKILNLTSVQYGHVFIVMWASWEDINNIAWAHSIATEHQQKYTFLLWENSKARQVVFVAKLKSLGKIACAELAGCSQDDIKFSSTDIIFGSMFK